jgi:hypothetical protein
MKENLPEALAGEMARVAALVERYRDPELNGVGELAARMMEADLRAAQKAIRDWNIVDMIEAYQALKDYSD